LNIIVIIYTQTKATISEDLFLFLVATGAIVISEKLAQLGEIELLLGINFYPYARGCNRSMRMN